MCNVSLNGTQPTDASIRVLRALEAAGLEAWYVGGWVRDALMGRPSHDVDMCCSGLWQESKAALEAADIAVVESGIKFGGITAICDGDRIEVTTYRLDGFYTDGRHPQSVERAASLEDDLARRLYRQCHGVASRARPRRPLRRPGRFGPQADSCRR